MILKIVIFLQSGNVTFKFVCNLKNNIVLLLFDNPNRILS